MLDHVLCSLCVRQPYLNSLDKAARCSTPAILQLLQARFPTEVLDQVSRFGVRSKIIVCKKEIFAFELFICSEGHFAFIFLINRRAEQLC